MLTLSGGSGGAGMRLICPGDGQLLVNVPAFRPVGSEERMTFGQGGTVETFVADPKGDQEHGGVTGKRQVPPHLEALLSGRVAANYGAQNSGPHQPLPPELVTRFVSACGVAGGAREGQPDDLAGVSACLVQDGERIAENAIRAIGTEPFWAAEVNGRCVTYSTPENQEGTRIWTRFEGTAESGRWAGALDNKQFVMMTEPRRGCSDGMSDKSYPIAATLIVRGEERRGCAEPR